MSHEPLLKPGPLHVLMALALGDLHGYALLRAVHEQSGGRVVLRTASLYRHLADLIDAALVVSLDTAASDDPRRRAYYRITPHGRAALERQRVYLTNVVATLNALTPAVRRGRG
jgi:DNA-binding PadR family transcriptional regulator